MATVTQSLTIVELSSQVSEVTGITNPQTIHDTEINLASNQRIFQIIITNTSNNKAYLKIWDRGSDPTFTGSAWDQDPDFVLPCEGNETCDYTFMGEDQYEFSNGIRINVGLNGGTVYDTSGTVSCDVLIFVKA